MYLRTCVPAPTQASLGDRIGQVKFCFDRAHELAAFLELELGRAHLAAKRATRRDRHWASGVDVTFERAGYDHRLRLHTTRHRCPRGELQRPRNLDVALDVSLHPQVPIAAYATTYAQTFSKYCGFARASRHDHPPEPQRQGATAGRDASPWRGQGQRCRCFAAPVGSLRHFPSRAASLAFGMQVVSICPLQVASVGWQPRAGSHAITVVCKATFVLRAGQSELADVQDYPNDEDNHWNDDPNRSLYSASDLAPFKPQADVTLVGEAYAPEGRPVRSVLTRLRMGAIDKSIEVVLDRHRGSDGELIEGKRFARMSLRYERAATGPRGNNPVGVNPKAKPDELGRRPLANLLPLGTGARDDVVPTVGYGPIAPSWPSRQGLLGRHAAGWSSTRWHEQPLPDDIDAGFFNVAPSDQRIDEIHCSERIVLDNLHPEEPRLVCHLPGIRPRVFVERQNAIRELAMHGDTLWIDTTRCVCTVTWRGRVDLDRAAEQGRVLIAMERPGQQLSWNDVRQLTASTAHELEPLEEPTDDLPQPATENAPIISSIREERTAVAEEFTAIGIPAPKAAPLPFVHDDQGEPAADRDAPLTQQHLATAALPILNVSPEDRSPAWLNQSAIYQPPQPHELVAPAAPQPRSRQAW